MAWTTDLVLFVRTLIGDLDSSKYADSRLEQIIAVAAYKVYDQADFNYTYVVDIATKEISPDPVDNKDTDFTVLTAYQAACIILGAEIRKESGNAISIKDGPSAIDLRGVTSILAVLYKDLCAKYEHALLEYRAGNSINGQSILGPYSPGSDLINRNYSDHRSGGYFYY